MILNYFKRTFEITKILYEFLFTAQCFQFRIHYKFMNVTPKKVGMTCAGHPRSVVDKGIINSYEN